MVEQNEIVSRIRTPERLAAFRDIVLASAFDDTPQLATVPTKEIRAVLDTSIDLLQKLERAARPQPSHP